MNTQKVLAFAFSLVSITMAAAPITAKAEIRSKTKQVVVLEPHDLPEQAQLPGNSFFLQADDAGRMYLYIEQQQGARLSVFDVSDPSRIRVVSSVALNAPAAFDFIRHLDGHSELVRFRDDRGFAVLDLRHVKLPTLRTVDALNSYGSLQSLSGDVFLAVGEPYQYVRALPRDFEVIDLSTPSEPKQVATIKQVKHQVANDETGTTYLLGADGLTVVRRLDVEEEYKTHQMQLQGN